MIFFHDNIVKYYKYFFVLLLSMEIDAQQYSYKDYLLDSKLLSFMEDYSKENKIDSLEDKLLVYKNRLGFYYYKYKAIVAKAHNDSNYLKYLDTAFMKGLEPLCLESDKTKFDSVYLNRSYEKFYLKAFDKQLLRTIDSLNFKDRQYRDLMYLEYNKFISPSSPLASPLDNLNKIKLEDENLTKRIDSLWKLQNPIDSTNYLKLKELILNNGWPSAKKTGEFYCQRPAPDPIIFLVHLGPNYRNEKIKILSYIIELCKNNEESWARAEFLIRDIYRETNAFSDFLFLKAKNGRIVNEDSFFSIYNMAFLLTRLPSKRLDIRCKDINMFNDVRRQLIMMNEILVITEREKEVYKLMGQRLPRKLDDSRIYFSKALELEDAVVQFRFSKP